MASSLPSRRRLVGTCGLLIGLTALSVALAVAGVKGGGQTLGLVETAVILAAAFWKATRILNDYLNLRVSTPGWRVLLLGFLLVIVSVVLAGQALILADPLAV